MNKTYFQRSTNFMILSQIKLNSKNNLNFFNFTISVTDCHCVPRPRRHKNPSTSMVVTVWIFITSKSQELRLSPSRIGCTGPEIKCQEYELYVQFMQKSQQHANGCSLSLSDPVWKLVLSTSSFNMLHSFAGQPCCYYWLWEIENTGFMVKAVQFQSC